MVRLRSCISRPPRRSSNELRGSRTPGVGSQEPSRSRWRLRQASSPRRPPLCLLVEDEEDHHRGFTYEVTARSALVEQSLVRRSLAKASGEASRPLVERRRDVQPTALATAIRAPLLRGLPATREVSGGASRALRGADRGRARAPSTRDIRRAVDAPSTRPRPPPGLSISASVSTVGQDIPPNAAACRCSDTPAERYRGDPALGRLPWQDSVRELTSPVRGPPAGRAAALGATFVRTSFRDLARAASGSVRGSVHDPAYDWRGRASVERGATRRVPADARSARTWS